MNTDRKAVRKTVKKELRAITITADVLAKGGGGLAPMGFVSDSLGELTVRNGPSC